MINRLVIPATFRAFLFLFFLTLVSLAQAQQVPQGMKYQAVARSLSGEVLANQPVTLKISLNSKVAGSSAVHYSETHSVTTNALGLFDLTIGAGKVGTGAFKNVPWSTQDIWMEIAIQDGGNFFTTISSSRLLAVPYAFHAMTASQLAGDSKARVAAGGPDDGVPSNVWSTFGNTRTNPATDRMGTMDYADLIFVTNKTERLRITKDGNINIANSLTVGKDVEVGNDLTVKQDVYLNTAGGVTVVNGPLTVANAKPTILTGTLNVNGATDLDNSLNVDGVATVSNVNQSTSKTNGALIVAGGVGIGKNLNVGGNGDVDGTMNVDGATTLKSTLGVDGATDLNSTLNADGATTLKSTVTVDGATDLNSTLNADGATTINNTLAVTGITTLSNKLNANAQVTINANVNGDQGFDDSYPLRVKGSNQGIVIEVDGGRANANNFITFRDANGIQGTIEGETYDELTTTGEFIATNALFAADGATIIAEGIACGVQLDLGEVGVMVAQEVVIVAQVAEYNARVLSDVGIAFTSGSGDYAEWLEKSLLDEPFSYGDIVGVRGGKITKNTEVADHFMVISLSPIVLGNAPKKGDEKNYRKVAFMGQVPVKVTGKVSIGDYIIPRGDNKGFGVAVSPARMTLEQYRQIVGVAWTASKANTNFSMINVAVGINSNDLVAKLIKQQAELDEVKGKMNDVLSYLKAKDATFNGELLPVPTSAPTEPTKAVAINSSPVPVLSPVPVSTQGAPVLASLKQNFVYSDFSDLLEKRPELFETSLATTKQNFINQGADLSKNPELNRLLNDKEYLKATVKKIYGTKK